MEADGAPSTPRFKGIQSYTDQSKVEADVDVTEEPGTSRLESRALAN